MKTLAFAFALGIAALGFLGIVDPPWLVALAGRFDTASPFYVLAAVRVAFGLLLISVAPTTRFPRAIRVVGFVAVGLGLAAGVGGLLMAEQAHAAIEAWSQQGAGVIRVSAGLVLVFGGFIAYACAPTRRAAA